jgi:hypothetical protein
MESAYKYSFCINIFNSPSISVRSVFSLHIVMSSGYMAKNQWVLDRTNRYVGSSHVVTTNNYYTVADLHDLQSLHTSLLSLFPLVFTIRFLATDL